MNKNGFTLVEMLVVVGLIAILSTVVGVNVVDMLKNQEESEYTSFKQKIADAACVYADLSICREENYNCTTTGCTISIKYLVQNGLIAQDLINPSTGTIIDQTKTISITYSNGKKTCTYNE